MPSSEPERPRIRLPHRMRETPRPPQERHRSSNRETLESVVIAFVLAFLFRTFEAEAFVIPTGSMAPTLMGRHKEVACQECGWLFAVGDSEDQSRTGALTHGVCPNCRFLNNIEHEPTFKGDRILVLKALYDLPAWTPAWLREPQRWDVVVFKFPEEPQVNYIKRLVGLPGEEIRIQYGNIYARGDGESEYKIARKSPEKQKVMRMLVYDNNHQPPTWRANRWPNRWQPGPGAAWRESEDGRAFESSAGSANSTDSAQLSYHHLVKIWGPNQAASPPRQQLISDFYAYNSDISGSYPRDREMQPRWVGDLALSVRVDVRAAQGRMRLELVESHDRFVCEFDLNAGTTRLLRVSDQIEEQLLATSQAGIARPGRYLICFGNTDDRLTVWLDDELLFGDGFDYEGPQLGSRLMPTRADLEPARIAVQNAQVRLSDLVLYRDIYYTNGAGGGGGGHEYDRFPTEPWEEVLSDPSHWELFGSARISMFSRLGPDDFMMMGDNSPRSKDGRLWGDGARRWVDQLGRERGFTSEQIRKEIAEKRGGQIALAQEHVVHRQLLIGRAFYVYWPHGVPFGPEWLQFDVKLGRFGTMRFPFYPNIARMKMIE